MLAGDFRGAVDVDRPRQVGLDVRPSEVAAENVVGADVDGQCPQPGAGQGDVARAQRVDAERLLGADLALVHAVERRAVDHNVGRDGRQPIEDARPVRHLDVSMAQPDRRPILHRADEV